MDLNVTSKAILYVLCLCLRQVSSSIKFHFFPALRIGVLFPIYILDGMEHFIERSANDKKFIRIFSNSKSIVETSVEKAVFCVESENLSIIEGIGSIVVDKLTIFCGCVHGVTLFNESFFRCFKVIFVLVEIGKAIQIVSISDEIGFILYF